MAPATQIAAVGDLTTDEGAEAVAARANAQFAGVDILVNNAGGGGGSAARPWNDVAIADYLNTYNLNVVAGVRLIHRLVPGMVARGWGRVINISSAVSRQPMGMMHDYAASKIALENLSLNLSLNLAPHGAPVRGRPARPGGVAAR
jgi:3-oxoacyl-[acyl-carrier protein] reductase